MTKKITCYNCGGKGWYTRSHDNHSWITTCEHCNGFGVVEVPYTNFDHIHEMDQEEFAKWLANRESCECCDHYGDEDCGAKYCEEEFNKFLSQEYKGGF